MAVLVLAEISCGALALDATAKAVTAGIELGDVTVLVTGSAATGQAVAKIYGVSKVLIADDALYINGLAEPISNLVIALADDYEHIIGPSTTSAKNILPRVAALLDVMIISDVIAVVDNSTFERPIYAGNAIQTVKSSDAKKILTIRMSTFDAAGEGGLATVEAITASDDPALSHHIEDKITVTERPELTSADIVVSGVEVLVPKKTLN